MKTIIFIEMNIIDCLRQQTDQLIAKFEKEFDEQHEYKSDLSDARKVELLIEPNAEEFVTQFQQYYANASELKEIIKHILKRLSNQAAGKYFSLIKKLVNDHQTVFNGYWVAVYKLMSQ